MLLETLQCIIILDQGRWGELIYSLQGAVITFKSEKSQLKKAANQKKMIPVSERKIDEMVLPISEPGAHSEEVLSSRWTLDRGSKSEEGVMLHGALPQMLASFLVTKPV